MQDKFELLFSFSCRLLTSLLLLLLLLLKAPEKLLYCIAVHYILQKPKKNRQLSQRVRGGLTGVHPEWKYGGVSIKC